MADYVDPEGPDGWIKDPCPSCGAASGERCWVVGGPRDPLIWTSKNRTNHRAQPHMERERAWQERRVREQASGG